MKQFNEVTLFNNQRTLTEVLETRRHFNCSLDEERISEGKVRDYDFDDFEDGFNPICVDENGEYYEVLKLYVGQGQIYRKVAFEG